MFERFTEASRNVLVEANGVAIELGSEYIGPEHIFYGCAEVRDETAGGLLRDAGITAGTIRRSLPRAAEAQETQADPVALSTIGIDYGEVREAVEQAFGPGSLESAPDRRALSKRVRKPPFTPAAKHSLELTLRAAQELHHHHIAPGHLLLGLLRLDNDFVSTVIQQEGSTVAALSAATLSRMSAAA